jgi:hypothetical protein
MMCIFPEGTFNNYEIFGVSALVIVFTATISKATKLPPWLVILPVAFVLYKAFCLDTIFFNKEKTGIVSEVKGLLIV